MTAMSSKVLVAALIGIFHFGTYPLGRQRAEPVELNVVPADKSSAAHGAIVVPILNFSSHEKPSLQASYRGHMSSTESNWNGYSVWPELHSFAGGELVGRLPDRTQQHRNLRPNPAEGPYTDTCKDCADSRGRGAGVNNGHADLRRLIWGELENDDVADSNSWAMRGDELLPRQFDLLARLFRLPLGIGLRVSEVFASSPPQKHGRDGQRTSEERSPEGGGKYPFPIIGFVIGGAIAAAIFWPRKKKPRKLKSDDG